MIKSKQISLKDIYTDFIEFFENDKPKFLSILDKHLDIDSLIPLSFKIHFKNHTGRPHKHPLTAFVLSLIIQRIFTIPTDSLLILFLTYSKELREFCGFDKVHDASKFT
jgi:hypothetical protein